MLVTKNTPGAEEAVRRSWRVEVLAFAALAVASVAAYGNSLHNDFVRDDIVIVVDNPMVHSWRELASLLASDYWAATSYISDELYRPLVMVSYLLNYSIGGAAPFGYHLVNLFLHVLVVFAVYQLGLRLRLSWGGAFVAGLFFAVHPIHTEAVDPVTGRADLLSSLGVLLALNWYIDLDRNTDFKLSRALASWGAFAVALLSKETGLVFPGLLVLYEVYARRVRGGWPGSLSRKGMLLLGHGLVLVAYMAIRWAVLGRVYRVGAEISFSDNPIASADLAVRVINALLVSGHYLWLFVWPSNLSADYSYNAILLATSLWDPRVLGAIGVWLGLGVLAGWSYFRGTAFAFFAVGCLVITFLPVSNLLVPIGTIMGERLFYMPSVGLCLLIGGAWHWLFRRRGVVLPYPRAATVVASAVVVVAVFALTARTIARNRDWSSSRQLWQAAARAVPSSAKVYLALGEHALNDGRIAESINFFERALEIYPEYADQNLSLTKFYGTALLKSNRTAEATPYLESAAERAPRQPEVHSNLGVAYLAQGAWIEAEAAFRKALALDIKMFEAKKGLMLSLRKQGRYLEAIAVADDALAEQPGFIGARVHKAAALKALGRMKDAQEEQRIIQRIRTGNEVRSK